MISDSVFKIHNTMLKPFLLTATYTASFIYSKMKPNHCILSPERKKGVKGCARVMPSSNSPYHAESKAYKLYKYEEGLSGVDDP